MPVIETHRVAEAYRVAQATIAGQAAAAVALAFRTLLNPTDLDRSFRAYAGTATRIINGARNRAARRGGTFCAAFRHASGVLDALPEVAWAGPVPPEQLTTSLLVTGPVAAKRALRSGATLAQAIRSAEVKTVRAAYRHTANAGRGTIHATILRDPAALGWARVSDGRPCYFCAMLCARGAVYRNAQAAGLTDDSEKYHDGCGCFVVPVYRTGDPVPGLGPQLADLWETAAAGKSAAAAVAAFRAAYDERYPSDTNPSDRIARKDEQRAHRELTAGPSRPPRHVLQDAAPAAQGPDLTALSDEELSDAFMDATAVDDPDTTLVDRIAAEMDRRDTVVPDPDPLDGLDLTTVPDHVLFDLWRQHDRSPATVERIATELDRRDRDVDLADEPDTVGDDDPDTLDYLAEFDDEIATAWAAADAADEAERIERARQAAIDARIDALIARGWDYLDAYADIHGTDVDELRRQERTAVVDEQRRTGETRDQTARRLYDEWVHLQWLAAENATNGYLLSAAGIAAGIDPRTLWGGTADRARKYASEELKRWWTEHPRRTLTEFRADLLGRAGDVAAAARGVGRGNDRDFGL